MKNRPKSSQKPSENDENSTKKEPKINLGQSQGSLGGFWRQDRRKRERERERDANREDSYGMQKINMERKRFIRDANGSYET